MSNDWKFFMCQMGDHLASIMVDVGIADSIESTPPRLARLRLKYKQPAENGLPTNEEFEAVSALEDDLNHFLAGTPDAYVGRRDHEGLPAIPHLHDARRADVEGICPGPGEPLGLRDPGPGRRRRRARRLLKGALPHSRRLVRDSRHGSRRATEEGRRRFNHPQEDRTLGVFPQRSRGRPLPGLGDCRPLHARRGKLRRRRRGQVSNPPAPRGSGRTTGDQHPHHPVEQEGGGIRRGIRRLGNVRREGANQS